MTDESSTRESEQQPKQAEASQAQPHPYMYLDEDGKPTYRTEFRDVTLLDRPGMPLSSLENRLRGHEMECYDTQPLVFGRNMAPCTRVVRCADMAYDMIAVLAGDKGRRYRVIVKLHKPKINNGEFYERNEEYSFHVDEDEAVALLEGDVLTFSPDRTEMRFWAHADHLQTDDSDIDTTRW